MRKFWALLTFLMLLAACNAEVEESFERHPKQVVNAEGITVEVYDFENFKPFLNQTDDKIYVINFWATWCIPCVAELPYFEQLGQEYPEIEVILVSLDFPTKIKENIIPFIHNNQLKSEVVLLDEPDGNKWIPQIDSNWTGAIPATIIYRNDQRDFYEQSFNFVTLEEALSDFKNKL